jgi:hypothetical protein
LKLSGTDQGGTAQEMRCALNEGPSPAQSNRSRRDGARKEETWCRPAGTFTQVSSYHNALVAKSPAFPIGELGPLNFQVIVAFGVYKTC